MKWKFTYKEFSILLGILVAIIILVTLWLNPFSLQSDDVSEKPTHKIIRPAARILAEKTHALARFSDNSSSL